MLLDITCLMTAVTIDTSEANSSLLLHPTQTHRTQRRADADHQSSARYLLPRMPSSEDAREFRGRRRRCCFLSSERPPHAGIRSCSVSSRKE